MNCPIFVLAALFLASAASLHAQTLEDTLQWMQSTLNPTEGNNTIVHRPFDRPYPPDWVRDGLDPRHIEIIQKFSYAGCHVEFHVDVIDIDMGFLLGRYLVEHDVDTFDLKDIDPNSIQIKDACASFDTPSGPTKGWNCEDEGGRILIFRTANAKARIHKERSGSVSMSIYALSHKTENGRRKVDELNGLCKDLPGNAAYCDQPEQKEKPTDETDSTLGFSTPEYARRFAKALRHAVVLCGGKPSTF